MAKLVVPTHVGLIIDGNRRWAKKHGLPTYEGHLAGYNVLKDVSLELLKTGVRYLSLYIFSTENWQRSQDEVTKLMGLCLRLFTIDLPLFQEHNVRLRVLGSRQRLSPKLVKAIDKAEDLTKNNTAGDLLICLNYGGQLEIVEAVRRVVKSGIEATDITLQDIEQNLYAADVPALDLIVRTSGEQRLSNFMLWRAAYSELLFIQKPWPDMTVADVGVIIKEYNKRGRRFGK